MKHPFELTEINPQQIDSVSGGQSTTLEQEVRLKQPIYYFTLALGEDGGELPEPLLM